MAAPAELKVFDYGPDLKYKMNQALTDKNDDVLEVQGVGMLKRKAISIATVTIVNKHYKNADGLEVFESRSSASGIPGAVELVTVDGQPHKDDNSLYGHIISTCNRKTPAEINDSYLTDDFMPESFDKEGQLLHIHTVSDPEKNKGPKWHAGVVSGFRMVDGIKRWVRTNHFVCAEKGMDRKVTIYYDFVSSG